MVIFSGWKFCGYFFYHEVAQRITQRNPKEFYQYICIKNPKVKEIFLSVVLSVP